MRRASRHPLATTVITAMMATAHAAARTEAEYPMNQEVARA
jgi:hypothetical protein